MTEERHTTQDSGALRGGGPRPVAIMRTESGLIAALAMLGTIAIDPGLWWFPLAMFLLFDLSILGYLRSTALGAFWYNAVHTYVWSAVLGAVAIVLSLSSPAAATWVALIALAWAFHVGVDRMLGYGLKLPDAFTHTHLGTIGNTRRAS
ncbi:DUF4260 domain-containing protein [Microbacterium sp. LRZ72]|uniref:DUF4260 family protein n=1 Tax=Microbacterium sp. LRZ72 TaxID=2942481 RepID=UPI0029AE2E2F|nr:DUF4260 family protein [Microbacterium sp. LRZ72]MDX2378083.1 DUF4260 domain-containing protein [Microbacterium sp. LRZ72]